VSETLVRFTAPARIALEDVVAAVVAVGVAPVSVVVDATSLGILPSSYVGVVGPSEARGSQAKAGAANATTSTAVRPIDAAIRVGIPLGIPESYP
jgi:hypothetical protein